MKTPYRHYSLPPVYKDAEWPLKTIRGLLKHGDVVSATVQELYELSSDQPDKMWEYLNGTTSYAVTENFVKIIKATYAEGIALHKLFGPEFLEIQLSHLSEQQRTKLEEKFPSKDELAGHLHVAELLMVMRRQSSQALLREEGLINDEAYKASLEETESLLAARGHYGIYRLVNAQPALKEQLDNSKKAITVPFAKGIKTQGEPSLSNYTVAAYLNSEQAYLDASPLIKNKDRHMEEAYSVCGGEEYADAFDAKCAAVSGLEWSRTPVEQDFPLTLADIASRSMTDRFQVGTANVRLAEAYAIKHAAALMDPATIQALEAAGKINLANAEVINSSFHSHTGRHPYAEHINDMYVRAYEREHPQAAQDAHTVKSDSQQLANDRAPLSIGHDTGDATPEPDADTQKKLLGRTYPKRNPVVAARKIIISFQMAA